MKHLLKITAILLFSSLLNFSCKKAETGPKGDTGAAGATGAQGPQGTPGTSNMQIQTFTTTTASWISYSWPYEYIETVLNVPAITSTVVANGDVRVYVLDAAGTSWMGMPYSFFSYQYNYKYKVSQVVIDYTIYNNGAPVNPGVQQFKVVIFPPAFIKNNSDIDFNDYSKVKERLKLVD